MTLANTSSTIDWQSITPANIITWAVMLGGWVAFWVKLKDRVDTHSENFSQFKREVNEDFGDFKREVNQKFDEQNKVLDEIKIQGSPASRQSAIVINSRIESQNQRLLRVESAVLEFTEIKVHVQWMKDAMQKKQNGKEL